MTTQDMNQAVKHWLGPGYKPCTPEYADALASAVARERRARRAYALATAEGRAQYVDGLSSYRRRKDDEEGARARQLAIEILTAPASADDLRFVAEADLLIDPLARCVDMTSSIPVGEAAVAWRGLVAKIALSFSGHLRNCGAIDISDLLQEGMEALRRAVITYSPEQYAFSTYGTRCVRNALAKVIETMGGPVRTAIQHTKGVALRVRSAYFEDAEAQGENHYKQEATDRFDAARASAMVSHYTPSALEDEDRDEAIDTQALHSKVMSIVDRLPYPERRAVIGYFFEGQTLAAIGATWEDSSGQQRPQSGERVRQLKVDALRRVRRSIDFGL